MLRVRSYPNPQCMQVEQLNIEICRHYVCPRLSQQARRLVVVVQKSGLAIVLRLAAHAVSRPASRRAAVTAACKPARSIKRKKCARLSRRWARPSPLRLLSPSRARAPLPHGAGVWAGCAVSSCRTGLIERCPHVTGALNLRASPPASSPCLNAVSREGIASARRTSALLRIGARAPPYSPLCSVRLFLMGHAISCAR